MPVDVAYSIGTIRRFDVLCTSTHESDARRDHLDRTLASMLDDRDAQRGAFGYGYSQGFDWAGYNAPRERWAARLARIENSFFDDERSRAKLAGALEAYSERFGILFPDEATRVDADAAMLLTVAYAIAYPSETVSIATLGPRRQRALVRVVAALAKATAPEREGGAERGPVSVVLDNGSRIDICISDVAAPLP